LPPLLSLSVAHVVVGTAAHAMKLAHNQGGAPSRQIRAGSKSAHAGDDPAAISVPSCSTLWFSPTNALAIAVEFELSYFPDPLQRWLSHPEV